ncbi:MAG: hypothetical protein COX46_01125 [bacterium (Candidatus Ratteibacteria) CG23_combo_of_CG06-09_8_20_14_all_48_7]|uniref:PIN domain-containing protein n=1 Tax=bacterium (Candidatus Ratteibacteria) CG23_combo_of_CG06-09_8_20_14_all_48_7 TaxID=2014292 RepID=A0A2G9YBN0_9BACT|nr:MAG: hypothetical protein COX46_01125 [bacterium (Candidatus Ratteibacteria) CG23_combo_of_CG06-09_8_20_14_all_48_7]
MKKLKVYLETSFWNYLFADDYPEEKSATENIFTNVRNGGIEGYISEIVIRELTEAPAPKREKMLEKISESKVSVLEISPDVEYLSEEYLLNRAIPEGKRGDALHVAIATVYELDALLTWNQRHLANLRRRELVHGINLKSGYLKPIEIITPEEVIIDETE